MSRGEAVAVLGGVGVGRGESVAPVAVGSEEPDAVQLLLGLSAPLAVAAEGEALGVSDREAVPLLHRVALGEAEAERDALPEGAPLRVPVPLPEAQAVAAASEGEGEAVAQGVGSPTLAEAQGDREAEGEVVLLMEGERLTLGLPEGERVPVMQRVARGVTELEAVGVAPAEGVACEALALREARDGEGLALPVALGVRELRSVGGTVGNADSEALDAVAEGVEVGEKEAGAEPE